MTRTRPKRQSDPMTRSGVSPTPTLVAFVVACMLGSLSLVAWRQSRAFEANTALDEVRRARSLAEAERSELEGRIQHLRNRSRVVPEARARLGMTVASDVVLLPAEEGQ